MTPQLDVFLPLPLTKRGPSYTCGMLAKGMAGQDLDVTIVTPRTRAYAVSPAKVVQTLPYWARYVPYRWVRSMAESNIEAAFLSRAERNGACVRGGYIWPDASLKTIRELKRANVKLFREMINCHRGSAKTILDDAYRRIGAAPAHTISAASVIGEQESLEEVDYIFCPSPMVEASLIENGIPQSKIISANYGWEPRRFQGSDKLLEPNEGITIVFAGSICVRKGCHLLLDYWARSGVRGRLVLAGALEATIREKCAELLAREDVVVLDYVADVGALYRSADIFAFPSLEEGAPLVTYEACGCGLPVITTSMGAGRIVRNGEEGLVLDPYDDEGWIAAIREMAENHDRRRIMGQRAAEKAKLFDWDVVALQRRQQMLERLSTSEHTV